MSASLVAPESQVTPEQRLLIQLSLDKALTCAQSPVGLFYQRLFELDPTLRPLFKCDMDVQERRLLNSLGTLVEAMEHPESFRADLAALGARHAAYGVEPQHYDTVREALIWALDRCLGATFTPEVRIAWAQFYETVAREMKQAAES